MAQYSLFNSTLLFRQNYSGLDVNKISIIPRWAGKGSNSLMATVNHLPRNSEF